MTLESTLALANATAGTSGPQAVGEPTTTSGEITRQSKNITIEGNIDNVDYQVISKPQHAQNLIAESAQDGAAASGAQN